MKRLFGILFAAVICITCLLFLTPEVSAAEIEIIGSGTCGDNLTWTLDDAGTLTISGTGEMYDYEYYYDKYGRYSTAPWNKSHNHLIKHLEICDGVTTIGIYAFYNCYKMQSVTIPDSVTIIGNQAFEECSSLQSVIIGDSVTTIGGSAFEECTSLQSVTIPDSVTTIGNYAFFGCDSLASVTIGDSVTTIGNYAFFGCTSLASVTIPDSVTTIGNYAFAWSSELQSVVIGKNVREIKQYAFEGCGNLVNVEIPDSAANCLDKYEFAGCSNLNYNIYDNGKYLGNKDNPYLILMYEISNDITSIDIHPDTKTIHHEALAGCDNLTSVIIPNNVNYIGMDAFWECDNLTTLTISDSVLQNWGVFENVTKLMFADGTKEINETMMGYIDAITVEIPNSVTTIGNNAFYWCRSLQSITIPDSVTTIGDNNFVHWGVHTAYTGTSEQWKRVKVGVNNDLDNVCFEAVDGFYYTKNCVNSGVFCSGCHCFIAPEKTEFGSHTYADDLTKKCNECDYVRVVKSISIYEMPNVLNYNLFTGTLDVTGGSLELNYSDNTVGYVDITTDMITGFDNEKPGKQDLIVNYEGRTTTYQVTISRGEPIAIAVLTVPDKRSYIIGDNIELFGLTLLAQYPNGKEAVLVADHIDSVTADVSSAGKKTATVYVGTTTATFEIFVHNKATDVISSSRYPQSSHNYGSNANQTKTFTHPGAGYLILTFDPSCYTETDCDFVYLYDGNGNEIGVYTGSFANVVVTVPGDTFSIKLVSDGSVNKYGYAFSSIVAETILHPEETVAGYGATCKVTGLSDGSKCTICGDVVKAQTVLPLIPHEYEEGVCVTCGRFENNCGDNARWWVKNADSIVISGTGAMDDYNADWESPWQSVRSEITSVVIEKGVTHIGKYAFAVISSSTGSGASRSAGIGANGGYVSRDGDKLAKITIPVSVTSIGDYAFANCTALTTVIYGGTKAQWNTIVIGTGNEALQNATVIYTGEIKLSGAAPTLYENITINYKANKTKFDAFGITDPYLVVTFNGTETIIREYTVSADGTQYIFPFYNIAPNQMNDTLTAVLYATYGGEIYASAPRDYSVAEYCYNQLSKYGTDDYAKFRTLLVDLLNYGSVSQQFTGYKTDNLVNAALTATQEGWATAGRNYTNVQTTRYETIENPTVSWKGGGLVLNDAVVMRFKFETANMEGLSFKIQSGSKTWTVTDIRNENGANYVYFRGLNAGQMSDEVFITAYQNGVAVSNTVRYSIESYASQKITDTATPYLAELVEAMMKYGDAANIYITP